jgi:TPR repeat protein
LYALGQVGSARLVFERAASAGNAAAAIALGDTYDPRRLVQLGAPLSLADIAKATYWYERADELGAAEAKARILGLAPR